VPDDAAGLRAANARLRALLAERDAEITVLRGHLDELTVLQAEARELRERAAGLEARAAETAARLGRNSRNSSKPPSADGPAKPAPESLRGKSGRKPGRPKGQPGAAMQLSGHPDKALRYRPARCGCCGKSMKRAAVTAAGRRQVIDIPPVKAVTAGHRLLTLLCGCGCGTKAAAPDGVTAPAQYGPRVTGTGICLRHGRFLSRDRACRALPELSGCAPSPGALAAAARKTAGLPAPALAAITKYLAGAEVVHFDETGFRTAGKPAWVHSASWGKFVLVAVHAERGKDGMKAAGVLPHFRGTAVRDARAPCGTFGDVAGRALCGARVLRELAAVTGTGPGLDKARAQQTADALPALNGVPRPGRGRRFPRQPDQGDERSRPAAGPNGPR